MKTPWLIAVRPTPSVLEKHGKSPNTIEVYEPARWWTTSIGTEGAEHLVMEMEAGPSVRWPMDLIDQITITRRTEAEK